MLNKYNTVCTLNHPQFMFCDFLRLFLPIWNTNINSRNSLPSEIYQTFFRWIRANFLIHLELMTRFLGKIKLGSLIFVLSIFFLCSGTTVLNHVISFRKSNFVLWQRCRVENWIMNTLLMLFTMLFLFLNKKSLFLYRNLKNQRILYEIKDNLIFFHNYCPPPALSFCYKNSIPFSIITFYITIYFI